MERTFVMLKPETVRRRLMGEIITRIERKDFKITAMKMMQLDEPLIREHYSHIADKPFFGDILKNMTSGPVVAMIVEGEDVVKGIRNLMGATKWLEAPAGTIRGDYANSTSENLIHGSDSVENAEIEIKRFFHE